MTPIKPLTSDRLHATFDPSRLEWEDSSQMPIPNNGKNGRNPFQPRAMQALDLALQVKNPGYNVYLSGEPDLGRTYMLLSYLQPRAAKMARAPDLVYVNNFANPDEPILLVLPDGYARKLKTAVKDLVTRIGPELEKLLNSLPYQQVRADLLENYNSCRSDVLCKMHSIASANGFNLELDEGGGISLSPSMDEEKKAYSDLFVLNQNTASRLKKKGAGVARDLMSHMRHLNKIEEDFRQKELELERKAMEEVLNALFPTLEKKIVLKQTPPRLSEYLLALKKDLLENCPSFLPHAASPKNEEHAAPPAAADSSRYAVNIFVDNSEINGAPVVVEDNPTISNLLGCMERESELGALVTDFTLIRSGSLQKANGGFLILHMEDLLQHPQSWEALLRSLRSSLAKVEDGVESPEGMIRTRGLSPEALPLDVKVILIGGDDIFEELLIHEDRFAKLFRIKAHMNDEAIRNSVNIKYYLNQIAQIIQEAELIPFNRFALAGLVDLGSHLCEDQKRLSLRFPIIRNFMIEADALAKSRNLPCVNNEILEEAYVNKYYRSNLIEEIFMEDYDRQMIKVETSGSAIGQVNGLSVTSHGDFEFGLPHRISCTVGVGHDGIIDLERESDLGGPIHTKAMLILKSYLTRMFARKKPLVLNASLYFEQSYAGIEGDSASGAELVALLSALADVPVRLDLAFTGALGHSGQIMAVGAVTRKIEGFYKLCAKKGLTGTQGVIIPNDNVDHLMLSPEILESVNDKRFFIYAVRNIEEALHLLLGMPAGKMLKNGGFTKGSLFDLVDRRLENLGSYAQNAFRRTRKE